MKNYSMKQPLFGKDSQMELKVDLKLDGYKVLSEIIERGCAYGWTRVTKHRDHISAHDELDRQCIIDELHTSIMAEIGQYIQDDPICNCQCNQDRSACHTP